MTTTEPVTELLFTPADNVPISTDEATLKPWAQARETLAESPKYWLATGRPGLGHTNHDPEEFSAVCAEKSSGS